MVNTLPQYLKRSPKTGTYSYERWVPEQYRHLFMSRSGKPKIIHRVSFKTKDLIDAEHKRVEENKRFDAICRTGSMPEARPFQLPDQHIDQIIEELRLRGLLPEQQIKIDALSDQATMQKIERDIINPPALAMPFDTKRLDEIGNDYSAALQANDWERLKAYQARRAALRFNLIERFGDDENEWPDRDTDVLTYRIIKGDIDLSPEPSINDALLYYINEKKLERRNPEQQTKLEADVNSITSLIFSQLPQGMGTKLSSLKKHSKRIREICEKAWPNSQTRLKNIGYLRSMINVWNSQDLVEEVDNPFVRISKNASKRVGSEQRLRRSGTSSEFHALWNNLMACKDLELKVIGLLNLYCGLPAREAKGMLRDDVKIKSSQPHLVIRNNKLRLMDKGRIDRFIPLVEPMLTVVEEYISDWSGSSKDDLLFPVRFHQTSAATAKSWKPYLVNQANNDTEKFSMYSFRHSFKERCLAAEVESKYISFLFGHSTSETKALSSATLDRYYSDKTASKEIIKKLTVIMQNVMALTDFGYREESDIE